jgi:glycosyl hydrolase family 25
VGASVVVMALRFNDVSHYQGNYQPHGPTIAKATEGTSFVDDRYSTNRSRTLAGGWPFAGYHFLTTQSASAQARHAHATIGSTPAMLDVETGTTGNPSLSLTLAFIDAYRSLGGVLHLVYLPKWYWSGAWGSPSLKPLIDRGMALISSQYTTYSDDGPGWNSYGGMKPAIWQYTSTPIDTNAFKGTQAALGDLFREGPHVALTKADGVTVFNTDIIPSPSFRPDASTNPTARASFALGDMWQRIGNLQATVNTLAAANSAMGKQISALVTTVSMISSNAGVNADEIIAAINAVGAQESDQLTAAQAQITTLQAQVEALRELIAQGGGSIPAQPGAPAAEFTDSAEA